MAELRYSLRGDVDQSVAVKVRNDLHVIVSASDAHLLIDCTHLRFIDSTGVAVLLEVHAELEADGRHMLIQNVQRGPRLILEALGLTDLLRYERDSSMR